MAIAKNPKRKSGSRNIDEKAAAFISAAGQEEKGSPQPEKENKKPVMVRFDPQLLEQVDEAAKKRGVSRSAWIQYTISRALENGEG